MSNNKNYTKLNLYLKPDLCDATDATVILEKSPVSVGNWIRRQMKAAFSFEDLEKHKKKARKKLHKEFEIYCEKLGTDFAFRKLSEQYGIPVARLKSLLDGE